jgi:hypothetical protein
MATRLIQLVLPKRARREAARRAKILVLRPRVGQIDFGDLRRLQPISTDWGFDRGTVIDR